MKSNLFSVERLKHWMAYRGIEAAELEEVPEVGHDYVSRIFRRECDRNYRTINCPSIQKACALAKALKIPLYGLFDPTNPLVETAHWDPVDWRSPAGHIQMLYDMARARCLLSISNTLDSYLINEDMFLVTTQKRFSGYGIVGEELDTELENGIRSANARLDARMKNDYLQIIIGPEAVPLWARRKNPNWVDHMRTMMGETNKKTAVGFVPQNRWPVFYREVSRVIPLYPDWHKVTLADDLFALVWVQEKCFCTYHPPTILQLWKVINTGMRKWIHYPMPDRETYSKADLVRCQERADHYLEGVLPS